MRFSLSAEEKLAIKKFFEEKGLPLDRAIAFSDVTLPENYSDIRSRSEISDFKTKLTSDIELAIPVVSANMESVTGVELAVALEREGGLAFPPQSLPLQERLDLIERIGRAESAFIEKPLTVKPQKTLKEAKKIMERFGISSLIVVNKNNRPIGILSTRDWLYEKNEKKLVRDLMTKKLITAPLGISFEKAAAILKSKKIEKLPLVDENGKLAGLITTNGLFYQHRYPKATRDNKGRFIRAGAIGVGRKFEKKYLVEIEAQLKRGISILLVDTARAFSINVGEAIKIIKKEFPTLPIVVGNVSTAEGAKFLLENGADVLKVGQGPGFACRTRAVGVGIPQLTAIASCSVIAKKYGKTLIADGGIKSPGDLAKSLIAGADAVMLGYLLVRTKESASPLFFDDSGRPVKNYSGSASFHAQFGRLKRGSLDRIRRPEGVTEVVPVVGTVKDVLDDLIYGLSSTMAYLGARNLEELRLRGRFVCQTLGGHIEGIKKI